MLQKLIKLIQVDLIRNFIVGSFKLLCKLKQDSLLRPGELFFIALQNWIHSQPIANPLAPRKNGLIALAVWKGEDENSIAQSSGPGPLKQISVVVSKYNKY